MEKRLEKTIIIWTFGKDYIIIPSLTVAEKINARIPCKLGVLAFYAS